MGDTLRTLLDNGAVMIVLIIFTAWLLGTTVGEIRKYACHRKDAELKRDMVDRGLSADEIERIVAAKTGSDDNTATAEVGTLRRVTSS